MADACPGTVTFFAHDAGLPLMALHRAQGKRVVFVEGDQIVATEGDTEVRIPLADIPLTRNGSIGFQVENAMSSIAAAWALGIDWAVIRRALATFVNDAATARAASTCSTTRAPR
jgi:cyanophycin synthetase